MPASNEPAVAPLNVFPPNSRYHDMPIAKCLAADGRTIVFLERRFVPPQESFQTLVEYSVRDGDRLDLIAAQYLGDPLLYWRLCDANGAVRPNDLLAEERIAIALPQGVQGVEL